MAITSELYILAGYKILILLFLEKMNLSSNLELIYCETNLYSGGPDINLSIVQRYHLKVKKWFKIIYHFGLIKTIRMRQKAPLNFCPHGDGTHYLLFLGKDEIILN